MTKEMQPHELGAFGAYAAEAIANKIADDRDYWKARAERAEAERDDLRAQLDAMHRKASNLELELEQSERQRREISDMADKMADKWTLQVEQLRARLDAAQEAAHMPDDWPHGLPSWIAQRLYAAYIGAAFAPEVMEQIAAGRLAFPEAPIYAEAAALRAENALLRGTIAAQDGRNLAATERVGMSPGGCDTPDDLAEEILALRAELEAARAAGGWRPVTEPPTENGDYLVWVKYPKEPGFHSVARWTQRFKWENNFVHPTYWRPLPAAPDAGKARRSDEDQL